MRSEGFGFSRFAGENHSGRVYYKVCEGKLFQSALLFQKFLFFFFFIKVHHKKLDAAS